MGIRKIPEETDYFCFYNANPKNHRTSDCVYRAIAAVTGKSWDEVMLSLTQYAVKLRMAPDDTKTMDAYLSDLGYVRQPQPYMIERGRKKKYTGEDFCKSFRGKTCIANIGGHHVTAIINSKIYDTWDCSDGCIGNYWIKKGENIN